MKCKLLLTTGWVLIAEESLIERKQDRIVIRDENALLTPIQFGSAKQAMEDFDRTNPNEIAWRI